MGQCADTRRNHGFTKSADISRCIHGCMQRALKADRGGVFRRLQWHLAFADLCTPLPERGCAQHSRNLCSDSSVVWFQWFLSATRTVYRLQTGTTETRLRPSSASCAGTRGVAACQQASRIFGWRMHNAGLLHILLQVSQRGQKLFLPLNLLHALTSFVIS